MDDIIKKIDHVNIRIKDVEESIHFYTDLLGFKLTGKRDLRPVSNTVSYYIERDGFTFELAWGHDMSLYSEKGIINHFAISVKDIKEAREYFEKNGYTPLCGDINVNNSFYCFFITGPNHESIEVIQYL